MSTPLDEPTDDRQDYPEEPEDPRLSALIEALARGETIDWQQAESAADGAEAKERIRALSAISEVATFHRTWLAEGGIAGDLDEDEEPDDEVPSHWGELEILERVGRGSFGDVYKAREPRLDRIVALKLIRASARTPEREAETLREGRLLAKVRHPNVATVHGTAGADGRVGFWMEFLEGKNLQEILQEKGRFEPREAADIGISLCRALAAVHAQGIVHRDVKAQNVVRENDGRIVLTDFGVGRDAQDIQGEAPSLSGTPLYLAPELFEGKPPSPASDLYALGVLLFYLVTGEFPITGKSFDELRDAHRGRKRRWLKELRKDLPGTFVAAVERALDRDPEKRAGVGELKGELGRFLGERAEVRRFKKRLIASSAIACVAIAVTMAFNEYRSRERKRILDAVGRERDSRGAVLKLEQFLKNDPKFVEGWSQLGLRRQTAGDHSGSTEAHLVAEKLCANEDSVECLRARAHHQLACLRYEAALPLFKIVVDRVPEDVTSWRQIGMLYNNLGQPGDGIPAALQASSRSPGDALAAGLLPLLLAQDSNPGALLAVQRARKVHPSEAYLYWAEGIAEMVEGSYEKAFAAFGHLEKDAPFRSIAQVFKGQVLLELGDLEEAEVQFAKGLSADSGNSSREMAQRRIFLAEVAIQRKDFPGARKHLRSLLTEDGRFADIPDNLKYLRSAAILAVRSGSIDLAESFSTQISAVAGEFPSKISEAIDAHVKGEIAAAKGDLSRGIDLIDEAFEKRREPILEASRIRLHVALGECKRAASIARDLHGVPGLIYADYAVPWIEVRNAIDQVKTCTPK